MERFVVQVLTSNTTVYEHEAPGRYAQGALLLSG
jgi:hypothetical protein